MAPINEYERQRAERIAANNAMLASLGLVAAAQELRQTVDASTAAAAGPARTKPAPRKRKMYEIEVEVRRSGRIKGEAPTYNEEQLAAQALGIDRLDLVPSRRRMRVGMDPTQLNSMRQRRIREVDGDEVEGEAPRGPFDSGLGVRIQGGRVYDSKYGVTCHWCRQKTLEEHVTCTHPDCGGGRRLAVSFCKLCLKNRHGEDILQAEASGKWVCPRCRGSCGEGCTTCCNCGPCRKAAGLAPTHQIINQARAAGFDNVHDYLVHRSTGETAEQVAARKRQADWGAWLDVPFDPVAAAAAAADCEGEEEEAAAAGAAEPAAAAAAVQLEGRRTTGGVPEGAGGALLLYGALRWHLLSVAFVAAAKALAPAPKRGRPAKAAPAAAPAAAPKRAPKAAAKATKAAPTPRRRTVRGNKAAPASAGKAQLPTTVTAYFKPVGAAAAAAAVAEAAAPAVQKVPAQRASSKAAPAEVDVSARRSGRLVGLRARK